MEPLSVFTQIQITHLHCVRRALPRYIKYSLERLMLKQFVQQIVEFEYVLVLKTNYVGNKFSTSIEKLQIHPRRMPITFQQSPVQSDATRSIESLVFHSLTNKTRSRKRSKKIVCQNIMTFDHDVRNSTGQQRCLLWYELELYSISKYSTCSYYTIQKCLIMCIETSRFIRRQGRVLFDFNRYKIMKYKIMNVALDFVPQHSLLVQSRIKSLVDNKLFKYLASN